MAEASGAHARVCTNPAAFFDALAQWAPTPIALDLSMPEIDGVPVIAEFARQRCAARVIISGGLDSGLLDAASRSAGENGLDMAGVALPEPFTLSLLRDGNRHGKEGKDTHLEEGKDTHLANSGQMIELLPGQPVIPTVTDLKHALQHGGLSVVYQPKVSCATGELKGG